MKMSSGIIAKTKMCRKFNQMRRLSSPMTNAAVLIMPIPVCRGVGNGFIRSSAAQPPRPSPLGKVAKTGAFSRFLTEEVRTSPTASGPPSPKGRALALPQLPEKWKFVALHSDAILFSVLKLEEKRNIISSGKGGDYVATEVVAALIWNKDRFLICQRPKHKTRGLLWEFVGGKVEPGETKQQALIRECQEELDILIDVGNVFMEVCHEYPDMTVELTLFHGSVRQGQLKLLEHVDIRWILPTEIENYDFCPADVEILERIRSEYGG